MSATHRKKEERLAASDECYTPIWVAREAVKRLIADGWIRDVETVSVLEPSVGAFAWVRALIEYGVPAEHIRANDINLDRFRIPDFASNCPVTKCDVLSQEFRIIPEVFAGFDLVVGNPPYNDTMAHLEVQMEVRRPMGVVANLLPIGWFTAQGGKERTRQRWLRGEGRPAHVYLVTPRPKFREGPGTDSAAYALMVWAPGAHRFSGFDILDCYEERERAEAEAKAEKEKTTNAK